MAKFDDTEGNESEGVDDGSEDQMSGGEVLEDAPPKPVSSDEESGGDPHPPNHGNSSVINKLESPMCGSRFFAPYRTVGIVSSGRAFHLIPHDHSGNAMVALPIGDRFQLMHTNHLRPAMVSQAVPGNGKQEITHVVTDATLSIAVVAHGRQPKGGSSSMLSSSFADQVTLYQRTTPMQCKRIAPGKKKKEGEWCIQDLLHLGRVKVPMSGEKEGKLENAAVLAAILRKLPLEEDTKDKTTDVPVVGDDDSDSSDSSSDEDDEESSRDEESTGVGAPCECQVVVLIASRQSLQIQKRIAFAGLPHFSPLSAVHPSTYLNKIVIGGFDTKDNRVAMVLLNIRSGKIVHVFKCLSETNSQICTLAQSPAVDTIAVGTDQGMVHLVNLRHDKNLFSLEHKTKTGNKPVAITSISFRADSSALQYATAPMAVGRQDGTITIWDLTPPDDAIMGRTILCEIPKVHAPGGISKLQFMPQEPLLLSTGTHSNAIIIHIFDNPDHSGRILRQRKGHTAPPRCIQYIHPGAGAGGGILASASDGTDAAACQILSSGGPDRTLRVFSTAATASDKEYGQGRGLVKKAKKYGMDDVTDLLLPPLTAMATCEARSRDWGDLVTIHEDHAFAYVWSTRRGAQSGPVLRQEHWNVSSMKARPPPHATAVSVALSACGNFALVGSLGGIIYKYNIQSGIPRGSYPPKEKKAKKQSFVPGDIVRAVRVLEKSRKVSSRLANLDQMELDMEQKDKQAKALEEKLNNASHVGSAVTGIAVDSVNKTVISIGADGKLILWNFVSHYPHKKSPFQLPAPATKLCLVRDSGLAAIALNDFSVLIFDTSTQNIIRRFGIDGSPTRHKGPISDVAFSPDGRSLYTASMDSTMRVWDLPTDTCVDWLSFKTPATSITVSPTGEFVATAHTGNLGLSVWSDRSFYETVYTDGEPPKEPAKMEEPTPLSDTWDLNVQKRAGERRMQTYEKRQETAASVSEVPLIPKEEGLVTLSGLPPSHWKNLFNLELVKQRNKPIEPPKKPASAPFFLQWRAGESMGTGDEVTSTKEGEDTWAAAWSDDDEDNTESATGKSQQKLTKRSVDNSDDEPETKKRRKIGHSRSHLASLLRQCSSLEAGEENQKNFSNVTEYIATLGPSGIDLALSTLCNGEHDLEEGLPLLTLAAEWLLEEVRSRQRYETVNAYLHRFLYLHGPVISGIEETPPQGEESAAKDNSVDVNRKRLGIIVKELREAHLKASNHLRNKLQRATCLLRHFSRMI